MLKAIIFDMDGVLINTEPLHYEVWKRTFSNHGLNITYDQYKACIGSTAEYLLELVYEVYGRDFRGDQSIRAEMVQIKEQILKEQGFPRITGVTEMIKRVANEGYLLAVASSSPEVYIHRAMAELQLKDYFSVLCSGENVANSKPAPDVFLKTAQMLQVSPDQCLVFEDSTNGCKAAKSAGMVAVGFYNPDSGNQNLSSAITIIDQWEQVDADFINRVSI